MTLIKTLRLLKHIFMIPFKYNITSKFFSLMFVALIITSCMKPLDKKMDFGPEQDPAAISKAIEEAYGTFDPGQIKKGDFFSYDVIQTIRGQNPYRTMRVGYTVFDKQNITNGFEFILREEILKFDSQGAVTEHTIKNTDPIQVTYSTQNNSKLVQTSDNRLFASRDLLPKESKEYPKVTYHNVAINTAEVDPPKEVKERAGCENLPNCKLNSTHFSYDEVYWESEEKTQKVYHEYQIAAQIPTVARLIDRYYIPYLNKCVQESVWIETKPGDASSKVLIIVSQCRIMLDFRFGSDN